MLCKAGLSWGVQYSCRHGRPVRVLASHTLQPPAGAPWLALLPFHYMVPRCTKWLAPTLPPPCLGTPALQSTLCPAARPPSPPATCAAPWPRPLPRCACSPACALAAATPPSPTPPSARAASRRSRRRMMRAPPSPRRCGGRAAVMGCERVKRCRLLWSALAARCSLCVALPLFKHLHTAQALSSKQARLAPHWSQDVVELHCACCHSFNSFKPHTRSS